VKRALLVTDGSEHSRYALQHLGSCPLPQDARLDVIHVLPPEMTTEMLYRSWPYGIDVVPPVISSEVDESLITRAEEEENQGVALLGKTLEALSTMGIQARAVLKRGDAATEILEFAQEESIDLIIVGSRGLSQIRNLLLGSVSSKITHYASCSVLVVKKPRID
jgi:nucleotide-binding universal stress UspA family protein